MTVSRSMVVGAVLIVAMAGAREPVRLASQPGPCDSEEVNVLAGASRSSIGGVVEYEVIGIGLVSDGVIVGAARRIWGDVLVDRWVVVSADEAQCASMATSLGARFHRFVAISGGDPGIVPIPPTRLELDSLAVVLADPVVLEIGTLDRVMAFIRVNWVVMLIGAAAVVLFGAVFVRRRVGRERGDYLF